MTRFRRSCDVLIPLAPCSEWLHRRGHLEATNASFRAWERASESFLRRVSLPEPTSPRLDPRRWERVVATDYCRTRNSRAVHMLTWMLRQGELATVRRLQKVCWLAASDATQAPRQDQNAVPYINARSFEFSSPLSAGPPARRCMTLPCSRT